MATPGSAPAGTAAARDGGPGRPSRWWWLLALMVVVGHLVVLYVPSPPPVNTPTGTDKVVHVIAFALPTIVLAILMRSVVVPAVIFAVHAPVSELIQAVALPDRTADVLDIVADLTGVGLVVLAWWAASSVSREGRVGEHW